VDGDLDLDLYDANGNFIDGMHSDDDNEFRDFHTVADRFYYLRVYGADGASNSYTLNISSGVDRH
jgi:hypothetical protein